MTVDGECAPLRAVPGDPPGAGGQPPARTWPDAVHALMAQPELVGLVFQPIVDLARGTVAGYEALARFPTTAPVDGGWAPPDRWFAAADSVGLGAELEGQVVVRALEAARTRPPGRFVTINVSPHLLHEAALQEALFGGGPLDGVVVELTEHLPVTDRDRFTETLDRLRARGASVALDDAGSGYSGLKQLAMVRPDIVKLDRSLVDHADGDEAKLALAELLGVYAGRLDACLLVEGVERLEELGAFQRLGVPLAQGWLFGAGSAGWSELDPVMTAHILALRDQSRRSDVVAGLVDRAVTVAAADGLEMASAMLNADPELHLVVAVDESDRPVSLVRRSVRSGDQAGQVVGSPVTLRVQASAALPDVAARAMTRDRSVRFDPVMCVDEAGGLIGTVVVERLVLRLVQRSSPGGPPSGLDGTGAGLDGAGAVSGRERPLRIVR